MRQTQVDAAVRPDAHAFRNTTRDVFGAAQGDHATRDARADLALHSGGRRPEDDPGAQDDAEHRTSDLLAECRLGGRTERRPHRPHVVPTLVDRARRDDEPWSFGPGARHASRPQVDLHVVVRGPRRRRPTEARRLARHPRTDRRAQRARHLKRGLRRRRSHRLLGGRTGYGRQPGRVVSQDPAGSGLHIFVARHDLIRRGDRPRSARPRQTPKVRIGQVDLSGIRIIGSDRICCRRKQVGGRHTPTQKRRRHGDPDIGGGDRGERERSGQGEGQTQHRETSTWGDAPTFERGGRLDHDAGSQTPHSARHLGGL